MITEGKDYRARGQRIVALRLPTLKPGARCFCVARQDAEAQGGSLKEMVTMTVFINDVRNGDRFVQIRKKSSGVLSCERADHRHRFCRPRRHGKVQGIAVIGGSDEGGS